MNEQSSTDEVPEGYCAPYTGSVCRKYINPKVLVYFNFSLDEYGSAFSLNEQITQGLLNELISPLFEPCRSAAETLLCAYAFPLCDWTRQKRPSPKPLCREDCVAVRDAFCYNEWALIEDNKQRGIYFKSRGHFRLPDCESLPTHGNSTDPSCSRAGLTELKHEEITYDCIKGKGRFYQGKMNVTKDGIQCQRWDSQIPHTHNRPPFVFPEIWNSENYCRNAGGEEPQPWCYTVDPRVRWQLCDIPLCENINASNVEKIDSSVADLFPPPLEPFLTPTLTLVLGSITFLVLILLVLIAAIIYRLHKYRRRGYNTTSTRDSEIDLRKLPSNLAYHCTAVKLNPKLEALEYPRNDIIYIRDIGQGAFGRVFQAKVPSLRKGEEFTMVAVKMLKDEASEDLRADFEREACLMADFDHPNIVKLLGVCAIGKPMCLLFEYMGRGDLNDFLRSSSPSTYIPYYGMTHEEVVKYIKDGNVLHCPENTPPSVYQLMKNCWNRKPSNRPGFKAIHKALHTIREELSKHNSKDTQQLHRHVLL
ncbi:tyrosine-protein kinase transmembrane receptor Ror2-like protein [Dinothrombium tinctorium]|uniref:receptor protein-tyrosine kinase n=1 Tax=Dinothrombium tinctorium TaxID=1965070 RepID=A0A3S4QBE3_9ACAR|nr:tyrosine-protein kinase transmembrane receptor Ror2-like protein [Dinothrombium tinctorium]